MVRIIDRFFLFLSSIAAIIVSVAGVSDALGWIDPLSTGQFADMEPGARYTIVVLLILWFLFSIRFLILSIRRPKVHAPSIDQKTDFGDIRISITTVENLALKAAARVRGAKDLKARISVSDSGLEISVRTVVDGESSIPSLTEEMQRTVKEYLENTTGIPVSKVTVYVANIIQSQTFKSRVE